ncbi:MAG: hypothetical protein SNH79_00860 [Rikenellaceae bacterium]
MKSIIKIFKTLALALLIALSTTSCGITKIVKSHDKLAFLGVTDINMKGLTGVRVTCRVSNDSRYNYTIDGCHAKLMHKGKVIAHLTQIGESTAYAHGTNLTHSTWKIEKIDPINTILLTARAAKMDFSDMTLDAGLTIRIDGSKLKVSRKNISLAEVMSN